MSRLTQVVARSTVAALVAGGVVAVAATPAYAASSTLDVNGIALTYTAAAGVNNDVRFTKLAAPADTYAVDELAGAAISSPDPECWHPVPADPSLMHCTLPGLVWLRVLLGDGDDRAVNSTDRQARILGGGGRDTITIGGRAGTASYAYGNDGSDTITSGPGNDVIAGDAGLDTVRYGGLSAVTASLITNTGTRAGDSDTFFGIENIVGSGVADTLTGNAGGNMLDGGSVTLCIPWCFTLSGNDTIYGNDGKDVMYGRGGEDTIWAGPGNDAAWGGTEDDFLYGQEGDDYLNGEALGDQYNELYGGPGWDTCLNGEQLDCEVVG